MTQPTQTMECTTEVPYISIYDKLKRRTLTHEEKLERLRQNYKRYYYENPERESLRNNKEYARKKEEATTNMNIIKTCVWLSMFNEFYETLFWGFLFFMNFMKTVFLAF